MLVQHVLLLRHNIHLHHTPYNSPVIDSDFMCGAHSSFAQEHNAVPLATLSRARNTYYCTYMYTHGLKSIERTIEKKKR